MTIGVLAALVAASRVVLVLAGIDAVYFDEEHTTGLLAKHLVEGLRAPFFDYQLADHHAGTLFMGALVAPLFALWGQSLFVLKLAPIAVHVVAATVWFMCCDRFFGRRVALIVGLLFILPPQLLARFSAITVGYHPESIAFTAVAVYALFRMTSTVHHRLVWCGIFGLVCGLGVWFAYIFVPTLLTSLVFWYLADRRFFLSRGFVVFLVGLTVGLAPWLVYNTGHAWAGAAWLSRGSVELAFATRARALVAFLTVDVYRSLTTTAGALVRPDIVSSLYAVVIGASYGSLLIRRLRSRSSVEPAPETWLLLYPWALAVLYAANLEPASGRGSIEHYGYEGFRYLVPLYPILFVIMAIALARALDARALVRRTAGCAIGLLAVAGLVGLGELMSTRNIGRALVYKPYSYKDIGFQRGRHVPLNVTGLSVVDKADYLLGRGWWVAGVIEVDYLTDMATTGPLAWPTSDFARPRDRPLTTGSAVLPASIGDPGEDAALLCPTFGAALLGTLSPVSQLPSALVAALDTVSRSLPTTECRRLAYRGLGSTFPIGSIAYYQFDTTVAAFLHAFAEVATHLPMEVLEPLFEGIGQAVGVNLEFTVLDRLDVVLKEIERHVPEGLKPSVYLGLGRGIAWRFAADPFRVDDLIRAVDVRHQPHCRRGHDEFIGLLRQYATR
jgi:hypothetical protein